MQRVFVLDSNREPLMPCHPARARQLLKKGKAKVFRKFPFTIILTGRIGGDVQEMTCKVDPGSKTTGIALVAEFERGKTVVWASELTHRGHQIKEALLSRRQIRRGRRNRKTRYRAARFLNRSKPKGWLPPSLISRVDNIMVWARRLYNLSPVSSLAMELVRFDTQLMQDAEISGVEYQQGELKGYEVREYLLEKWDRKCAYCGAEGILLEVEHIVPKSRGGSNRVNNLTLACKSCNLKKGTQTAKEFGFPDIQKKSNASMRDTAAVNATRWELWRRFEATGLPLEVGTGGRTKFNRVKQGYQKAHWIDAACVGESGESVNLNPEHKPLLIKAVGRQSRQMCRMDKYGFPRTSAKQGRIQKGFQTGDIVKAVVASGIKQGVYVGRVAVRSSGSFNITTREGVIQHISYRHCRIVHRSDGYSYSI